MHFLVGGTSSHYENVLHESTLCQSGSGWSSHALKESDGAVQPILRTAACEHRDYLPGSVE